MAFAALRRDDHTLAGIGRSADEALESARRHSDDESFRVVGFDDVAYRRLRAGGYDGGPIQARVGGDSAAVVLAGLAFTGAER